MGVGNRLYSLLVLVVVAVVGGALSAGLAVPSTALVAAGATQVLTGLLSVPAEFETPPQAERSVLLDADGAVLAEFYDQNRTYVSLDEIAPVMRAAQVAIEDARFYEHGALDLKGTLRALVSTFQGVTQGGSTITQQYVRLVLVNAAEQAGDEEAKAAATENTMSRKIRELQYATAVEERFSKDEILERYLNISYYGDGAYGVEAAAQHYFGVSAAELDLAQAAMLAGLVQNPVYTNPVKYPRVAIERRNTVLDRMLELGIVTAEQAAAAKAEGFDADKVTDSKLGCANSEFPFVCQYALNVLLNQASSLGDTEAERKERVYRGGLTIQTTIDPRTQRKSEKTISSYISAKDPVVSVIVMLEPGTGRIVAMAQNRQEMGDGAGQTYYNYAVNEEMGGADGFQGGSTFKAFVAASALEQGMGAYVTYNARQYMSFGGQTFESCSGKFVQPTWNVTGGRGVITMFDGVKYSVNTYFAQLIRDVGVCASVTMAKRLGLEMASGEDLVEKYNAIPSFTLGAVEITPLSLAEAYATFAARGVHCDPVILTSITTPDGTRLDVPSANCERVLSADVADGVNLLFQGPYNGGTATSAKVPGVQMAGKTGTVPDNKAIWTVGYTPELAAAAMVSYDNNPKYKKYWDARGGRYLRGVYLKHSGHYLYGYSGSEAGAMLLKPAFAAALKDYPATAFTDPPDSILRGDSTRGG